MNLIGCWGDAMGIQGLRVLLVLLLLGLHGMAQAELMVEGAVGEDLKAVTISVFAGENSHAATIAAIPVPRTQPLWTGSPNPSGTFLLPKRFLDGRRGLVVAKSKSQMAFLILGNDGFPREAPMPLVLSTYKLITVSCRDANQKPCQYIPVFMADAGRLMTHHLS